MYVTYYSSDVKFQVLEKIWDEDQSEEIWGFHGGEDVRAALKMEA
jgi:hypothetical protein